MLTSQDYKKYLDPSVVARIGNLELKAKLMVEGFMAGLHRSPYRGFSVEFAEHRPYMPGDDLRYLDWKIIAKSDRYYIKQYEEETNLKSYILLDISRSMTYSGANQKNTKQRFFSRFKKNDTEFEIKKAGIPKVEYGSYLAAALSYLMMQQRDAVSLTTYDTQVRSYYPPRSTNMHLKQILKELSAINPQNKTGTAACLNDIASKIKRRGMVIVISDLFDDPSQVINALRHFRYKNNEVIVFQVLDPSEINFLEGNAVTLIDLETREEMFSQPFAMQKAYREMMKEFVEKYKTECRRNGIEYTLLSTADPFDKALFNYLSRRKRAA